MVGAQVEKPKKSLKLRKEYLRKYIQVESPKEQNWDLKRKKKRKIKRSNFQINFLNIVTNHVRIEGENQSPVFESFSP